MAKNIYIKPAWVIVPAPWRVNDPPQANNQKWIMTLTGIVDINFKGNSTEEWSHETFNLYPDLGNTLNFAYGNPPSGYHWVFKTENWAPLATINSIYNESQSINAGYAVDSCEPAFGNDYVFRGLQVVVGVRDSDGYLFKIGYQVTLLGTIIKEVNIG